MVIKRAAFPDIAIFSLSSFWRFWHVFGIWKQKQKKSQKFVKSVPATLKIVCCVCPLPSYIRFGAIVEKLREIDKMVRRSTRNSIVKSELPQVKVEVTTKNAVIKLERLSEEDIEKFSKKPIEEDEDEEVAINARKNFLDALDDSDKENEENENKENVASKVKKWKPTTLGQGQKIRRPLAPMRPIPKKEELSDYEKIRQENIAEQRLKFLQVMIRRTYLITIAFKWAPICNSCQFHVIFQQIGLLCRWWRNRWPASNPCKNRPSKGPTTRITSGERNPRPAKNTELDQRWIIFRVSNFSNFISRKITNCQFFCSRSRSRTMSRKK